MNQLQNVRQMVSDGYKWKGEKFKGVPNFFTETEFKCMFTNDTLFLHDTCKYTNKTLIMITWNCKLSLLAKHHPHKNWVVLGAHFSQFRKAPVEYSISGTYKLPDHRPVTLSMSWPQAYIHGLERSGICELHFLWWLNAIEKVGLTSLNSRH